MGGSRGAQAKVGWWAWSFSFTVRKGSADLYNSVSVITRLSCTLKMVHYVLGIFHYNEEV